jgi:hypothetical protein
VTFIFVSSSLAKRIESRIEKVFNKIIAESFLIWVKYITHIQEAEKP